MTSLLPRRDGQRERELPRPLAEDGTDAAPGELGAVTIGKPFPCLARTVWNDHPRYVQNYLSTFPGHYFAADGGLFDQDGLLWVTGRLDDVINVACHRIGTMELEAALLTHPAVSEAAVVPQDDAIKGVVPVAFVVPRTRSGKIMRRVLRVLLTTGEATGDLTSLDNPESIDVVRASIGAPD